MARKQEAQKASKYVLRAILLETGWSAESDMEMGEHALHEHGPLSQVLNDSQGPSVDP